MQVRETALQHFMANGNAVIESCKSQIEACSLFAEQCRQGEHRQMARGLPACQNEEAVVLAHPVL